MHKSRLMRYFAIFALLTALVGSMVIGPVAAVFAFATTHGSKKRPRSMPVGPPLV